MNNPSPIDQPPTDELLIDYLLGEFDDDAKVGGEISGPVVDRSRAIEAWLAADVAHADRLESLAVSVLSIALASEPEGSRQPVMNVAPRQSTDIQPHPSSGRMLMAVLALAATILVAILGSWRSRSSEPMIGRVAVVWAEFLSAGNGDPDEEDAAESESERWDAADDDDWLVSALQRYGSDRICDDAFASGCESPPEWLLNALAQMSPVVVVPDPGADPVLPEEIP